MTDVRESPPAYTAAISGGVRGKSAGEEAAFIDVWLWRKQKPADDPLNMADPHEIPPRVIILLRASWLYPDRLEPFGDDLRCHSFIWRAGFPYS
jgi:hypothetical protein